MLSCLFSTHPSQVDPFVAANISPYASLEERNNREEMLKLSLTASISIATASTVNVGPIACIIIW